MTMEGSISRVPKLSSMLVLMGFVTTSLLAQNITVPYLPGVPWDWSHHHAIFSAPASAEQANKLQQEPRYWHQTYHRAVQPAAVPVAPTKEGDRALG